MKTVEPLRDYDLIQDIADYLKDRRERDYVLFECGLFLGRRISDLLHLRVRDVKGKDVIYIKEQKTSKDIRIPINPELKSIFNSYCKNKKAWEYLFAGRGKKKPITRQRVWQILNEAADYFECEDNIGCHTLRKTFGYWLFKEDPSNIVALQEIFNHSSLTETKKYIGVNRDVKDQMIMGLSFKKK